MLKCPSRPVGASHGLHHNTEPTPLLRHAWTSLAIAVAAAALVACGSGDAQNSAGGGRGGRGGTPTVGYVVVQQGSAPIEQELPGRVAAYQVSEVRPQVSGVIQRRLFREGSIVRQGQTLYQIDPSIYTAQAGAGRGQPAERPGQRRRRADPRRALRAAGRDGGDLQAGLYRRAGPGAAGRRRGRAEQRRASGARRSTCASPASRRRSAAGSACRTSPKARWSPPTRPMPLTTITRLDPVFVDIQQSAADLLALAPGAGAGRRRPDHRAGPAEAARRIRLRLHRDRRVQPGAGRPGDRHRHAPRPLPQSAVDPAPRHVRHGRSSPRRSIPSAFLVPQPAVTPRSARAMRPCSWSAPAIARSSASSSPTGRRAPYWVVTQGLAAGRKGDHAGHRAT